MRLLNPAAKADEEEEESPSLPFLAVAGCSLPSSSGVRSFAAATSDGVSSSSSSFAKLHRPVVCTYSSPFPFFWAVWLVGREKGPLC